MRLGKFLKGCWDFFRQGLNTIICSVILLYLNRDTVNGFGKAISDSGIGLLAWWQTQAAITNSRLVVTFSALVAVLIAQTLLYRRFKTRLIAERSELKAQTVELRENVADLAGQLEALRAPSSPPVFEPDRQQSMVIRLFWQAEDTAQLSARQVGEHTTLTSNEAALILEELCRRNLLRDIPVVGHGRFYSLSEDGRKFAAEMVSATEKRGDWPAASVKPNTFDGVQPGAVVTAAATQPSDVTMQLLLDTLSANNAKQSKAEEPQGRDYSIDLARIVADAADQVSATTPAPAKISASELQAAIRATSPNEELTKTETRVLLYLAANPTVSYSERSMGYYFKVSGNEIHSVMSSLNSKGLIRLEHGVARVGGKVQDRVYSVTSKGQELAERIR